MNFCWDQKGRRGRRKRDALWCMFCVFKANLSFTPHFLNLELILILQFQKWNWQKFLPQTNWLKLQTWIWKIWLIHKFFLVPGGREDMWLTARTHCRHANEKMNKIWLAIQFCPWDFRTCSQASDMSGTSPGHFQLRRTKSNSICYIEQMWKKFSSFSMTFLLQIDLLWMFLSHITYRTIVSATMRLFIRTKIRNLGFHAYSKR